MVKISAERGPGSVFVLRMTFLLVRPLGGLAAVTLVRSSVLERRWGYCTISNDGLLWNRLFLLGENCRKAWVNIILCFDRNQLQMSFRGLSQERSNEFTPQGVQWTLECRLVESVCTTAWQANEGIAMTKCADKNNNNGPWPATVIIGHRYEHSNRSAGQHRVAMGEVKTAPTF